MVALHCGHDIHSPSGTPRRFPSSSDGSLFALGFMLPRAEASITWVYHTGEGVPRQGLSGRVKCRQEDAMSESIVTQVQNKYAAVAASELSGANAGVRAVAEAFGYSAQELARLPAEVNMGLSCGNPTAFASL